MAKTPNKNVRGTNIKTSVKQAPKMGLNNLRCSCGGVLKRDGHGAMRCTGCRKGSVETPL